jgi:hypothetical protein
LLTRSQLADLLAVDRVRGEDLAGASTWRAAVLEEARLVGVPTGSEGAAILGRVEPEEVAFNEAVRALDQQRMSTPLEN